MRVCDMRAALWIAVAICSTIGTNAVDVAEFSCDGGKRAWPLDPAEDVTTPVCGVPLEMGGQLSFIVVEAVNLPDTDSDPLAARDSDPYLDFTILNSRRRSTTVDSDLNPKWPADKNTFDLGRRASGTPINIRVMDEDSGLEGADDLLGEVTTHVIACSRVVPYDTFPCDETAWVSLTGQACVTTGTNGSFTLNPGVPCLRLRQIITPFTVSITQQHPAVGDFQTAAITLDVVPAGDFNQAPATDVGRPWYGSADRFNAYDTDFKDARDGMFVRTLNDDKASEKTPYYTIKGSDPMDVWVFISENDLTPQRKVPTWLEPSTSTANAPYHGYGGWTLSTVGASRWSETSSSNTEDFVAFHRYEPGRALTFGGPRVGILAVSEPSRMFAVVVKMRTQDDPIPPDYTKVFDRSAFFLLLLQFGFPLLATTLLAMRFVIVNLQWRIDRLPVFIAALTALAYEGENLRREERKQREQARKELELEAETGNAAGGILEGHEEDEVEAVDVHGNVLSLLLRTYSVDGNDDNFIFRRNVYYLRWSIYTILASPFVILFSWGFVAAATAEPANIGHFLLFVVPALYLILHATVCWQRNLFRMEPGLLAEFAVAFVLLFVFLLGALVVDKRPFDTFAVSVVFLTLNVLPIIYIAFLNDPELQQSFKDLVSRAHENTRRQLSAVRMSEGDDGGALAGKLSSLKKKSKKSKKKKSKKSKKHKKKDGGSDTEADEEARAPAAAAKAPEPTYAHLVGDAYTMNEGEGRFKLVDALNTSFTGTLEYRQKLSMRLYLLACVFYLAYAIVVAAGNTAEHAGLGFFNVFVCMVLDSCVYLLRGRGRCTWSPGYTSFLLVLARLCIAAGVDEYWVLGHSAAYLVVGLAIGAEIVAKQLPRLSIGKTAAIAYFGHDTQDAPLHDVSGYPEFVLGYELFIFLVELLAYIFSATNEDPLLDIYVIEDWWPMWSFGVIALLAVIDTTAIRATARAFQLADRKLLLTPKYFWTPQVRFPYMLALFSEVLLICSGVLILGITGSTLLFDLFVFFPLVAVSGGLVFAQWVRNDFNLLEDPIKRARNHENGEGTDEEQQALLGKADAADGVPANASLPPMTRRRDNGGPLKITMPTLPVSFPRRKPKQGTAASNQEDAAAEEKKDDGLGDLDDLQVKDTNANETNLLEEAAGIEEAAGSDPATMYCFEAFRKGALTRSDYATITLLVIHHVLTFVMGAVISSTETRGWLGYAMWASIVCLELTLCPIIKYFNSYEWTKNLKIQLAVGFAWFYISLFVFFGTALEGSINSDWALFLWFLFMWYPTFLALGAAIFTWRDSEWKLSPIVSGTFAFALFLSVGWVWTIFAWTPGYMQPTLFLFWLGSIAGFFYTKNWAENEYYWSPPVRLWTRRAVLFAAFICVLIGLFAEVEAFYFFSTGFLLIIARLLAITIERLAIKDPGAPIFFSTFVFPIYAYDPSTNDIVSENRAGAAMYAALGVGLLWGVSSVIFVDPLGIGAVITALVLVTTVLLSVHFVSLAPRTLSASTLCCDDAVFAEAGLQAQEAFEARSQPLVITCPEVDGPAVHAEGGMLQAYAATNRVDEKDDKQHRVSANEAATRLDYIGFVRRFLGEMHDPTRSRIRRRDAPCSTTEALSEAFYRGNGPLGWVFWFGMLYEMYMRCYGRKRLRKLAYEASGRDVLIPEGDFSDSDDDEEAARLEKRFDEPNRQDGAGKGLEAQQTTSAGTDEQMASHATKREQQRDDQARFLLMSEERRVKRAKIAAASKLHSVPLLLEVPELEEALAKGFRDELRCVIHFQVLVVVATDARIRRESILFQKFLRETRFKLLANNVAPPDNVFKTKSYATVDVGVVATWLRTLTPEQRERFHMLKARFSQEVEEREAQQDEEVALLEQQESEMRRWRRQRDWEMNVKRWEEFQRRRLQRKEQGRPMVPDDEDEAELNAREALAEVKGGWATKPGTMGRAKQFVDPYFPPDSSSVGNCYAASEISGWKTSLEINKHSTLFAEGTDPDDVFQGHLHNGWLLSAISMLAASGGIDDGDVDELVDRLFITKETSDTGAYALRLWKNSQWETVLVDDYFPTLGDEHKMTPSGGAAFSYSKGFEEAWVPLIEKAYAKYHGSYAVLESGFVHHALEDLTGGKSEEIFLLRASRGASKALLWAKLRKYFRNRYILGAGTVSADVAERGITDSGLVWGAAYVIYEVRQIDGHRLLKLRNPPNNGEGMGEWQGDWSDQSDLWTRRLKAKLGHVESDDGTFWMSFDDFCIAFRSLYVCRYFHPEKWRRTSFTSWWRGDTAMGLPAIENQDCQVEKNPQYSLTVHRPTDVAITLSQTEDGMARAEEPLPIAVFIVDTGARLRALRVTHMTNGNVLATSGEPKKEYEVTCSVSLKPGTYTVLVATYLAGMEGPFTLAVHANFDVGMRQLWPPPHRGVLEDDSAVDKAKNRGGAMLGALRKRMGGSDEEEARAFEAGIEEEARKRAAASAQPKADDDEWVENVDPETGGAFFYNKKTGVSSWHKPDGFVSADERRQRRAEQAALEDGL